MNRLTRVKDQRNTFFGQRGHNHANMKTRFH